MKLVGACYGSALVTFVSTVCLFALLLPKGSRLGDSHFYFGDVNSPSVPLRTHLNALTRFIYTVGYTSALLVSSYFLCLMR